VKLAGRELAAKVIGKFGKVVVLMSEMAVEVAWSWPVAAETFQGAGLGVEQDFEANTENLVKEVHVVSVVAVDEGLAGCFAVMAAKVTAAAAVEPAISFQAVVPAVAVAVAV
ncbi:MAG: hypothetical protein ACK56I_33730, partial [bacterium]